MDKAELVDEQIEDGKKLIEQLARDGFIVTAAFWIKFSFTGTGEPWFFYVVSKEVEEKGPQAAYRAVHASIHRITGPWGPWISLSELKLVGPNDTLASQVIALQNRYPGKMPTVFPPIVLGGVSVDGLYIYPLPGVSGSADAADKKTLDAIHNQAQKVLDSLNADKKEEVREGLNKIIFMSGQQLKL
jgi:hypothetical protein